jgi:excisionase family DNA binding protein
MTTQPEVTVTGVRYWAENPEQLAQLLATSRAPVIGDPNGQPVQPDEIVVFTCPQRWAENRLELRDALTAATASGAAVVAGSANASGAVAAVEDRLVFTVEEAAQLLGISRSFAYEAVQRGEIPSMRIGRRILVPKTALLRFLASDHEPPESEREHQ